MVSVKRKAKRVLGIDSSTGSIAWCLFVNRKPYAWGEEFLHGKDVAEKCGDAQKKMDALLNRVQPDFVCIESVAFINSKDVALKLAMVFGSIVGSVTGADIAMHDITATKWQYYIGNDSWTAKRKADLKKQHPRRSVSWYKNEIRRQRKQYTIDWCKKRYGLVLDSDNVADAMGIAYYAYNELTRR